MSDQQTPIIDVKADTKPQNSSLRDERGLLKGIDYILNKDGTVNWRAMINPAHLYPNKDWFNRRNLPTPETSEGLRDEQLLIKLGGIKELAKLRGFECVDFDLLKLERDYVVSKCTISWIRNFECASEEFFCFIKNSDVANATTENTDGFGQKFLETIAANRSFVRAVRNFLGIHIVGEDEIAKSGSGGKTQTADGSADVTPQAVLSKKFQEVIGGEFSDFREWLRTLWKEETYRNEEAKNWNSWSDVPSKEARTLLKHLKL